MTSDAIHLSTLTAPKNYVRNAHSETRSKTCSIINELPSYYYYYTPSPVERNARVMNVYGFSVGSARETESLLIYHADVCALKEGDGVVVIEFPFVCCRIKSIRNVIMYTNFIFHLKSMRMYSTTCTLIQSRITIIRQIRFQLAFFSLTRILDSYNI